MRERVHNGRSERMSHHMFARARMDSLVEICKDGERGHDAFSELSLRHDGIAV